MKTCELRHFIGKRCEVAYLDRKGALTRRELSIEDIAYVPLYGDYLIGDTEDICVERVQSVQETA